MVLFIKLKTDNTDIIGICRFYQQAIPIVSVFQDQYIDYIGIYQTIYRLYCYISFDISILSVFIDTNTDYIAISSTITGYICILISIYRLYRYFRIKYRLYRRFRTGISVISGFQGQIPIISSF